MASLDRFLPALVCPICQKPLTSQDAALTCQTGHTYNVARQGYASFVAGGTPMASADTPAMVQARADFLASGHFAPIARAVATTLAGTQGLIVDLPTGTGYYLAAVLDQAPYAQGLGVDLSAAAARRAANCHQRAAAITANAWTRLPLVSHSAAAWLNIFGPRPPAEIRRCLATRGQLVAITPGEGHLGELRERLDLIGIGQNKLTELDRSLKPLCLVGRRHLHYSVALTPPQVVQVITMGPNAHHQDPSQVAQATAHLPQSLEVSVDVYLSQYSWDH